MICWATLLAVLIGTAKPIPTEPLLPVPVAICELIPITLPPASISGPPELPGLIGRVGLDDVGDREAVRRADLPLQRRDDPRGDGPVEAVGVADRDRAVADLDLVGVAELQRLRVDLAGIDGEDGDVARVVDAEHLRRERLAVAELDGHRARAIDDVSVGEHVAVAVDEDAGAGRDPAAGGTAERRRGRGRLLLGGDEGHSLGVLLVDLVDRLAGARGGLGLGDRHRGDRRRAGGVVDGDQTGRDRDDADGDGDDAPEEGRSERAAEEGSGSGHAAP